MSGIATKAIGVSLARMIPQSTAGTHLRSHGIGRRNLTIHNDRAVYLPEANQLLHRAKLLRDDGLLDDNGLLRAQECTDNVITFKEDGEPCVDQARIEELRSIIKGARNKKAAHAFEVLDHNPHPLGMVEQEPLMQSETSYPNPGRIL